MAVYINGMDMPTKSTVMLVHLIDGDFYASASGKNTLHKIVPAENVPHICRGEWEWHGGITCSVCGEKSPHVYPFCPWCGAQNGNP